MRPEVRARAHPHIAAEGRRDGVRYADWQNRRSQGDIAHAHGRPGQIQANAATPRVPGAPQGALQRRQLNATGQRGSEGWGGRGGAGR